MASTQPVALELPSFDRPAGRAWLQECGVLDGEVSREQVVFTRTGDQVRVRDAGSSNGTWVDGLPLDGDRSAVLQDGSILRFGRTLLVYQSGLEGSLDPDPPLGALVGPFGLRSLHRAIDDIRGRKPGSVLVEGPTGTGKELVATVIADALGRKLTRINISAIPETMFEAQLFGWAGKAFAGADSRGNPGVFRASEGGAVFLDEIGSLPLSLQPKILRLLEDREVQVVGSPRPVKVDVAVIAATNVPLPELVDDGRFRADLAYRLARKRVELVPVCERREDILPLAAALLQRRGLALDPASVEVEAAEHLLRYGWPGNVRELDGVLEEVRMRAPDGSLPLWAVREVLGALPSERKATREDAEAAMAAHGGNQSAAARALRVSRGKLRRLLGLA